MQPLRPEAPHDSSASLSLHICSLLSDSHRYYASICTGQQVGSPGQANVDLKKLQDDELIQKKDSLEAGARALNQKIDNLGYVVTYARNLKNARGESEKQALRQKISEYEPWSGLKDGEGTNTAKVNALWNDKQAEKMKLQQQIRAVDSEVANRLAARSFKKEISLGCAGIVTIVVVGFFLTASRSPAVISKIFGGQEGLQFITLFSLVVAIILFGVTGVLEGKELSALLGGLAGYILGRSGHGGSGADQSSDGGGPKQKVRGVAETPTTASSTDKVVAGNGRQ